MPRAAWRERAPSADTIRRGGRRRWALPAPPVITLTLTPALIEAVLPTAPAPHKHRGVAHQACCPHRCTEDGGQFCGMPVESCSAGHVQVEGMEARIYEIEPLVIRGTGAETICPRDQRKGAAYVDAVGEDAVGHARFMLSYTWGYTVRDIVEALGSYCKSTGLDERRTYVWICCLCISECFSAQQPIAMRPSVLSSC